MAEFTSLFYYQSALRLIEKQVVRFEIALAALHAEGKDDDEITRELKALEYGRQLANLDRATRAAISAWRRVIPKGGNGGGGGQRVLEKGGKKRTPGDDGR